MAAVARDRDVLGKLSEAEIGRFMLFLEARADVARDEIERMSLRDPGGEYAANVLRSSGKLTELRTLVQMMEGELNARRE